MGLISPRKSGNLEAFTLPLLRYPEIWRILPLVPRDCRWRKGRNKSMLKSGATPMAQKWARVVSVIVFASISLACERERDKCGGDYDSPCADGSCHAGLVLDSATGLCLSCGYEFGPCCGGAHCAGNRTCMDGLGRATSPICATAPSCAPGGAGPGAVGSTCLDNLWCCPGLACLSGRGGELRCQPNPGTCWSSPIRLPDGGSVGQVANEGGPCFQGNWCCPFRGVSQINACTAVDAGIACVVRVP
jgi:hypothetical protein